MVNARPKCESRNRQQESTAGMARCGDDRSRSPTEPPRARHAGDAAAEGGRLRPEPWLAARDAAAGWLAEITVASLLSGSARRCSDLVGARRRRPYLSRTC